MGLGLALMWTLGAATGVAAHPAPARDANLVEAATLALRVDPAFTALPPLAFPIERLTDARRHVFVEPGEGGAVRRMVVLQFERVQAGSDFRFVFPSTPPMRFGAETWRAGAFVYDDARAAAAAPEREAARTRTHLRAHGYRPPRLWRVARLARVADPQGLSEAIIFYMENADGDHPAGPLPGADADGDLVLTGAARAAMLARLAAAVEAVRG